MEEVVIERAPLANRTSIELAARPVTDTTELLKRSPGANINSNGPLTGIAQVRGLYGQRVNTRINGSKISSGGPNLMDPPLSYSPASVLEDLTVYRDIAPVSAGQETLGGAIVATPWRPAFSDSVSGSLGGSLSGRDNIEYSGKISGSHQSVNDASEAVLIGGIASQNQRAMLSLLDNRGNDSEFKEGKIRPTEFKRQRAEVAYGFRQANHTFSLSHLRNETDAAGTPALPMDIKFIDTDSTQLGYNHDAGNWGTNFTANHAEVEHEMTNFHLRQPPAMADMYRANRATADSNDAHLQAWFKTADFIWRTGIDFHDTEHNSLVSNPNSPAFFVDNFRDAEQQITGVYLEFENPARSATTFHAGLRVNYVSWDAGTVNGTPAMMNAAAGNLRDQFNAADRSGDEINIDAVIQIGQQVSDSLNLVTSVGRKNRGASYQERYLWLPMRATAGLADGNTYIGNIDLDAETSHEIAAGFDYQDESVFVSPRIFYKKIDDYIQGTPVTDPGTIMFSTMMMGDATPLQFNNIDARLYGADIHTRWEPASRWRLESVVSYVRGTRRDTDDDLYRIAPLNGMLSTTYVARTWSTTLELEAAAAQNKVSEINNETSSAGYSVWNLHAKKELIENFTLSAGVKNIFDRNYADHLSGVNRAMASAVEVGARIPGNSRNIYTQLTLKL